MNDRPTTDQKGQTINGPQTNAAGDINGPVFSGQFQGDFTYIEQAKPHLPLQIPAPPADFTGQEEEIEETMAHFDKGLLISSIQGLGGIGKTDLAKKLSQILRGRFPDGQIMIDLLGTTDPSLPPVEAMRKVVQLYVPAERMPKEDDEIRGIYQSVLNGKHLLLLLDNARDGEQVRPLLPPPNCAVIVTSRQDISLPGMRAIRLDEMKPEKAEEMLKRIVQTGRSIKGANGTIWKEIARLCGYLPLALRLAGTFLANSRDLDPEDYAGSLRDERRRLEGIDKGSKRSGEIGVQASLLLSYSRLPDEAAGVFRMLSIFPADFDSRAEEAICQDEDHEQLSELLRWNLVDYQEETKRYRLHDLVRIYAYDQLEVDGELAMNKCHQLHSAYYLKVLNEANELLLAGGSSLVFGLNLFDLEWPNIKAGQAWARLQSSVIPECSEICINYARQASILNLRLHSQENIQWLDAALECARRTQSKEAEGAHLSNLGNAFFNLGETRRAIDYYEQALAIACEIGDRRSEGNVLGNLGSAFSNLGDARKALEHHEKAWVIDREIGDRRSEGISQGNLGLDYAALNDAHKAIEYCEQALKIAQEIDDRRNEGIWLGCLGNAYYALGDSRQAIEYFKQALKIAQKIDDRIGEANSLWGQAICLKKNNDLEQAIINAENALKIFEQIESPSASTTRKLLAQWRI